MIFGIYNRKREKTVGEQDKVIIFNKDVFDIKSGAAAEQTKVRQKVCSGRTKSGKSSKTE